MLRLTIDEALDITPAYSADERLIRHHPFRALHHTISFAGLIGCERWPSYSSNECAA